MKKQSIIWLSLGFIITATILITLAYKYYLIHPIVLVIFITAWLISGVYFDREILKTSNINKNSNNIFAIIFSFVWLPYVVISVFTGMVLGLTFTKKENAQFLMTYGNNK